MNSRLQLRLRRGHRWSGIRVLTHHRRHWCHRQSGRVAAALRAEGIEWRRHRRHVRHRWRPVGSHRHVRTRATPEVLLLLLLLVLRLVLHLVLGTALIAPVVLR